MHHTKRCYGICQLYPTWWVQKKPQINVIMREYSDISLSIRVCVCSVRLLIACLTHTEARFFYYPWAFLAIPFYYYPLWTPFEPYPFVCSNNRIINPWPNHFPTLFRVLCFVFRSMFHFKFGVAVGIATFKFGVAIQQLN